MTVTESQPGTDYAATVTLDAPIESVFGAIATVDGIRGWWAPRTSGNAEHGGELRFEFPAHQVTKSLRVEQAIRPVLVRWACVKCTLTEWEGTAIVFELASAGPDRTELTFRHVGLHPSLDCYDSCSVGWDHYLRSLRSLVETGTGMPYGS